MSTEPLGTGLDLQRRHRRASTTSSHPFVRIEGGHLIPADYELHEEGAVYDRAEKVNGKKPFPTWNAGGHVTFLPRWMTYTRIIDMMNTDGYVPSMNRVAGPTVLWGFSALAALTYYLALIPIIQTYTATCHGTHSAFAHSPDFLVWVLFFLPAAAGILVCQHICMLYLLLPMISISTRQVTWNEPSLPSALSMRDKARQEGDFEIFGIKTWRLSCLTFRVWYILHCFMTLFTLLDNMTNALFTARMVSTESLKECTEYKAIQHVWYTTWTQSWFFGWFVELLGEDGFQFEKVVLISYFLQWLLQPAVALYFTFPWPPWPWRHSEGPDFAVIEPDPLLQTDRAKHLDALRKRLDDNAYYRTAGDNKPAGDNRHDDKTDYASAFIVLAEACRMEVFTTQDMIYREALMEQRERSHTALKPEAVHHEKQLELAITCLMRGIMRFALRGLLQNAIQVNLQVSLLAIGKSVPGVGVDLVNAFTTFLTVLCMFGDVPDQCILAVWAYNFRKKVNSWNLTDENKGRKKLFQRRLAVLGFCGLIYFVLALTAFQKLVNIFRCPCGVSNLSGCVGENAKGQCTLHP